MAALIGRSGGHVIGALLTGQSGSANLSQAMFWSGMGHSIFRNAGLMYCVERTWENEVANAKRERVQLHSVDGFRWGFSISADELPNKRLDGIPTSKPNINPRRNAS
jgi:hypothetical protein